VRGLPAVSSAPLALRHEAEGISSSWRPVLRRAGTVVGLLVVGLVLTAVYSAGPFVVIGISDGAVYALAALGLVLTYKTSGIFNFAIGAQAAASAYVFYSMRVTLGLPWPVAALCALVLVGLIGSLLLERVAFWLTDAPAAMKVVATIALIVLIESVLTGAYGQATLQFASFLPTKGFRMLGVTILGSQVIVVVLALAATAGLYLFFKRSRLGVSMQAVVDSPTLLALEASNPVVVRRYAWAIGSCFISISGMLLAPTLGIDVNIYLLTYIAAFGAAAVAGFSSLPITFAAAMGIGIAMNVMSDKLGGQSNLVVAELYTQVPFLVLVGALVAMPRARLLFRGASTERKLRPARTFAPALTVAGATAGAGLAIAVPFIVGTAFLDQYTTGVGYAVILASLGLLLRTSGQISLCQVAFAALGASTFGHALSAGLPWLVALAVAVGVGMASGALAAIPSFRLSGVYLAVATFGFGLLLQNLIYPTFLMFGQTDAVSVTRPHLFGLNATSDRAYYYLALVIAALSRLGRLLRGLSDSPLSLSAHGTDTRLTRLYVFCAAAGIAAAGGVLIAGVTQSAGGTATGPFGYFNSVVLLAVLALCGSQPLVTPVIAAFAYEVVRIYAPFSGTWFANYEGAFFGLGALAVALAPGMRVTRAGGRTTEREGRSPVASRAPIPTVRTGVATRGAGA